MQKFRKSSKSSSHPEGYTHVCTQFHAQSFIVTIISWLGTKLWTDPYIHKATLIAWHVFLHFSLAVTHQCVIFKCKIVCFRGMPPQSLICFYVNSHHCLPSLDISFSSLKSELNWERTLLGIQHPMHGTSENCPIEQLSNYGEISRVQFVCVQLFY